MSKLKVTARKYNRSLPVGDCGFTLIELLVTMAIGTIIMASAVSLFKTSLAQNRSATHSAHLQNEGFFITHVLKQQISQIGYRPIDVNAVEGRLMPIQDRQQAYLEVIDEWEPKQTISVSGNTLSYRYHGASNTELEADSSIYDCLGNPIANGLVQTNQISLVDNQLVCIAGSDSGVILGSEQSVFVENIAFEIGIDDDNDNVIDRKMNASGASPTEFINAKQLVVRLLLATPDSVTNNKLNYFFNGTEQTATDRKLRRETEVSMMLRN